jgi:hypothetical protein
VAWGHESGERVLLVGEGDFTFAEAVVSQRSCRVVCATSLLDAAALEAAYGAARTAPRLTTLRDNGVVVAHNVDATALYDTLPCAVRGDNVDRVVWNFPSAGADAEDGEDRANAALLAQLFLSLTDAMLRGAALTPDCRLTLTLQGDQYSRWRAARAARAAFWYPRRACDPPDQARLPWTPKRAGSSAPIPMDGSVRRYEFGCCLASLARKPAGEPMGPHTQRLVTLVQQRLGRAAAAVVAPPSSNLMAVQLPAGVVPGQLLQVRGLAGNLVQFAVPAGAAPGQTIQVRVS